MATNIFLYLTQSLHMFCFSDIYVPIIGNAAKKAFFNKLFFSVAQSFSLKLLSRSLLSGNALFVTFSCKISLSVFSFLKRFLNFFHFFARLFSSCCLKFKCFSSSCFLCIYICLFFNRHAVEVFKPINIYDMIWLFLTVSFRYLWSKTCVVSM